MVYFLCYYDIIVSHIVIKSLANECLKVVCLKLLDFVSFVGLTGDVKLASLKTTGPDHLALKFLPCLTTTNLLGDHVTTSQDELRLEL